MKPTLIFSKKWFIGLETAAKKIKVTTQKGVRSDVKHLNHGYHTKQNQIWYNTLNCTMYSDTMLASTKATRGHTMFQVFVMDRNYSCVARMYARSESGDDLSQIFLLVRVPRQMVIDGAK